MRKKKHKQGKHWSTYQTRSSSREDYNVPLIDALGTLVAVNKRPQLTVDVFYEAINEAEVKRKEEKETVCHLPTHRKRTESIIPA